MISDPAVRNVLTYDGVIPAVAIEHTDEGWVSADGEPALIASFYVSIKVEQTSV